jgi:glucose-6-phosphate isomerase
VEKTSRPDKKVKNGEGTRETAHAKPLNPQTLNLGPFEQATLERVDRMEKDRFSERLWQKDPGLWKDNPEDRKQIQNSLGWLNVAEVMQNRLHEILSFAQEVREAGFRHVVHMGMGGSSLAPLIFERTFKPGDKGLALTVLDTTDPSTIGKIERGLSLEETLFIVASKSGTTAEPSAFGEYFYSTLKQLKGEKAGENFVAITDPGTPLVKSAEERGFRKTFLNFKDIGGRYSALSYFGLVPVALMGLDLNRLMAGAIKMSEACGPQAPGRQNPGLVLGSLIGELGLRGRNKLTLLMPEGISTLGMWLEQLLAESTGKEGTGILPVAGEGVGEPSLYGKDRLFVFYRVSGMVDERLERARTTLQEAGEPIVIIEMADRLDLAQEFFRWEIATAAAGVVLGINPFDQPDVQVSKSNTDRFLGLIRENKPLPEEEPSHREGPLHLYTERTASDFVSALSGFFGQAVPGDYVALLAYLSETKEQEEILQRIRIRLRNRLHLATTLGYGPRFLHSTGQFHKGGPNTGLFLQLTSSEVEDLQIPGEPYTFGTFKYAQALGDLQALKKNGRRLVRIHMEGGGLPALNRLDEMIESALENLNR